MNSNLASFKHHSTSNFQVAPLEIPLTSLATRLRPNQRLEHRISQQWKPLERFVKMAVIYP